MRPVLKRNYEGQVCSIAGALELIGERWTLLIVRDLFLGVRRFDDLQGDLGIARNVLRDRLIRLVDEGIAQAPLPGAPRALRIRAHREGRRPLAGAALDADLGRPLRRAGERPGNP